MASMTPRVVVVTAGHLSTTPRMLKAADALHAAGYRVRVVSANHTSWAQAADRMVMASRRWQSTIVDYSRESAGVARITTGARFKAANAVSTTLGASRVPAAVAVRAYSRAHDELVRAIVSEGADCIYGGTTGALAAIAEAAAEHDTPYGVDLEDWHSGEHAGPEGGHVHALAGRIERGVIDGARFVTASSPMIAAAYAARYRTCVTTIHNTFSIAPSGDATGAADRPLRLYWFSQTIGSGRGLEDVIAAAGRLNVGIELHLRGRGAGTYVARLRRLQQDAAPLLSLVVHDPAPPDDMVSLAQDYDAGLSCELPAVENHRLCLGNKIFTYLAAGVPVILSRTPAQSALASDLGDAAIPYDTGDVAGLADQLRRLLSPERRALTRLAARVAAQRRWHWEHPLDRGALLTRVAEVAAPS
jgi:glycosyltransferase involved in cell wall biosynthesis